jgi:UDP-N-acetyl-2-amino-2-deoxyglucuronate dehydrogenase
MEPLKVAVIGLKGIGRTHLSAIASVPEVRLTAVCDVLEDVAAAAAAEHGVPHYADLDRLLADADVEAVSLGTPHHLHAPQAVRALEAGKHVLTEKPMARTARECDAMIEAARKACRKLGVHHQYRTTPPHMHARKLVDAGEIGPVLRVLWSSNGVRTQAYYDSDAWRGRWETEGGGVLINQTVHDLDLLCWLCGTPAEVSGMVGRLSHRTEVEDIACAAIRFANGGLCSFQVSITDSPGGQLKEIAGDRATLQIGKTLTLKRPATSVRDFVSTCPEMWGKNPAEAEEIEPEPREVTGHAYIFQDFAHAVREDREPFVSGEQGRWAVELVNGILMSHVLGRRVLLPVDRDEYDRVLEGLAANPIPFSNVG